LDAISVAFVEVGVLFEEALRAAGPRPRLVTLSLAGLLYRHALTLAFIEVADGRIGEANGPAFYRSELVAFARALFRGGNAFSVAFYVKLVKFRQAVLAAFAGT